MPFQLILPNPSSALFRVAAHSAGTATSEIKLERG